MSTVAAAAAGRVSPGKAKLVVKLQDLGEGVGGRMRKFPGSCACAPLSPSAAAVLIVLLSSEKGRVKGRAAAILVGCTRQAELPHTHVEFG